MTSKRYTVQQLASMSGVSVRTLHHYDQIGLLVPASLGENGYRYYGAAEMLRLQQVLLHREFGLPLKDIAPLLDQAGIDRVGQLQEQKAKLLGELARCRSLVETIDRTIASLTTVGEFTMDHADLYKGFAPEKQDEYAEEMTRAYGKDVVEQSAAIVDGISTAQSQAHMDELAEIELSVAHLMRQGAATDDARLLPLVERHRAWVATMWGRPCSTEWHAGLADMYASNPDFRARFESIAPGLSDYLSSAIKAVATRPGHRT